MDRKLLIGELSRQEHREWDLIVIGGGATGLGIALDGVSRGFQTLLLEQSDFAKGTSSRSTKLVHGGVRYMAQGDLFLVMEALRERGLLLKNAPNLTFNQEFIIPVYSIWDAAFYTIGMKIYDLMAGSLSMGKSYFIGREEVSRRLPGLKSEGLRGGVVYHDGQFDDSRLAVALAREGVKRGCVALNYFRVNDLLKGENGRVIGVSAGDLNTGKTYNFKSRLVINATGVFADNIIKMDTPGARPFIRPSQGVHIVLESKFIDSGSAVMIPKTEDGRVLFAIPWYGKVVVGTTDTPISVTSLEPVALTEEIEFILKTAGKYLIQKPERKDILCVFAGLRPLAADPGNPSSTKEISRRHKIIFSKSKMITVTGGKWTTYRLMAEETIDRAIKEGILVKRKCQTERLLINCSSNNGNSSRYKIYGDQSSEIERIIEEDPDLGKPMHSGLPYTKAEIIYICRREMPLNLEDILGRRTRALFLDVRASITIAPLVAKIMSKEMGFGYKWEENQVIEYNKLVANYL